VKRRSARALSGILYALAGFLVALIVLFVALMVAAQFLPPHSAPPNP
jgi:hypothetical protein